MCMKLKIFTEAGSEIGFGHISRCSALYYEAIRQGFDVEVYLFGEEVNLTFLGNIDVQYVNWMNKEFLQQYLDSKDLCIVDSYLANQDILSFISNSSKRVIFIDDNNRLKYPKGLVVNPSFDIGNIIYPNSRETLYYWGKEYVILRDVFTDDSSYILKDKVAKVLVMMGGTDIKNLTPIIIKEICNKYVDIHFDIITTQNKIDELNNISKSNVVFHYNVDAANIKKLMESSDFAITAAGQTVYELIRVGLPFIAVKTAENQNNNLQSLLKYNLIQDYIDCNSDRVFQNIKIEFDKMVKYNLRKEMSARIDKTLDGKGAERLINFTNYKDN